MLLSKNVSLFMITGLCLLALSMFNTSVSSQTLNAVIPVQQQQETHLGSQGIIPLDVKWLTLTKNEIGMNYDGGSVTVCKDYAFVGCNLSKRVSLADFLKAKYPKLNIQGYTPLFASGGYLQSLIIYYK